MFESSKESINVVDVNININIDYHQYLDYSQSHTKRSIVYSQTLRARLCLPDSDFLNHAFLKYAIRRTYSMMKKVKCLEKG